MAANVEDMIRDAQQRTNGDTPLVRLPNRDQMPPGAAPMTVEMGGRTRKLRLDFYALMRLEEATGEHDLGQGGIRRYVDMSQVTFKQMTQFIWCMCLADDPSLDTDDPRDGIKAVGHWFDVIDMYTTYQQALEAAAASMPEIEENATAARPKATASRRKGASGS